MILKNKLKIKSEIELAKEEERTSKLKAKKLFESGKLDSEILIIREKCIVLY
ncbi:hypothetical protein MNB_SV-12-1103 [hydrothermal vent metagenome]|uniref:Uncharacterized protein n=1 Tax=hydrothermal vent metagenome TaxID=652676 RepID=A0A1W1BBN4_9ZZZZ